jgi:hypothetical protein
MKKLYLDDVRFPRTDGWSIVRSYEDFTQWILENGVPSVVSFDHDLGVDDQGNELKSGYDAAKWLCNYCAENGLPLPNCNVHSANPVGAENIRNLISSFQKKFGS